MASERIVAIGLLTRNDVRLLGPAFDKIWPVEPVPCFTELLEAIDAADRDAHEEAVAPARTS